ncbi:hypothetical protein HK100_000119 [Physocladia obscura]|uniref:Uncharacterized protein n=1 Tax=Physocladia obscura TaxID=109957 RepID=A0AAD5T1N4_9FUNG|nr:hypothetical protein HK100_000119 [Physocladia obscura]
MAATNLANGSQFVIAADAHDRYHANHDHEHDQESNQRDRRLPFNIPVLSQRINDQSQSPNGFVYHRNRKWKRIHTSHIRYDASPYFFDETMPDALEGKQSNFIYSHRIHTVNEILSRQKSIKDVAHIQRHAISLAIIVFAIILFAVLPANFPVYFAICLVAFIVWTIAQAYIGMAPRYEKLVRNACLEWTNDDIHLHLAYESRRAAPAKHDGIWSAVRGMVTPEETDWFLAVYESVAIFPVQVYGGHREDGSGWTAVTIDAGTARMLPLYSPPWDATPAPQYIGNSSRTTDESASIHGETIANNCGSRSIESAQTTTSLDGEVTIISNTSVNEGSQHRHHHHQHQEGVLVDRGVDPNDDDGDVSLTDALEMPSYKCEYDATKHQN